MDKGSKSDVRNIRAPVQNPRATMKDDSIRHSNQRLIIDRLKTDKETQLNINLEERLQENLTKYAKNFEENFISEYEKNSEVFYSPRELSSTMQEMPGASSASLIMATENGVTNSSILETEITFDQSFIPKSIKEEVLNIRNTSKFREAKLAILPKINLANKIEENILEENTSTFARRPNLKKNTKESNSVFTEVANVSKRTNHAEEEVPQNELREKAKSTKSLMHTNQQFTLDRMENQSSDISYYNEYKNETKDRFVDPELLSSSIIYENPTNLLYQNEDFKKHNEYMQMFNFTHQEEELDTDLQSVAKRVYGGDINPGKSVVRYGSTHDVNSSLNIGEFFKENSHNTSTESGMLLNELSVVGNGKNRRNEMLGINPASEKIMKNPTSRKEVKDLEKWLNLMLEKIEEESKITEASHEEVQQKIELIYTACEKELIRQISIDCLDRGILFERVWNAYLEIIESGQKRNENDKSSLEQEHLDEVTRIHKMYEEQLKFYREELTKSEKEIEEQNKQKKMLDDAISYLRKKIANLKSDLRKEEKVEDDLRFELEAEIEEKMKLKMFYNEENKTSSNGEVEEPIANEEFERTRIQLGRQQQSEEKTPENDAEDSEENNSTENGGRRQDISFAQKQEGGEAATKSKKKFSVVSHLLLHKYELQQRDEATAEQGPPKVTETPIQPDEEAPKTEVQLEIDRRLAEDRAREEKESLIEDFLHDRQRIEHEESVEISIDHHSTETDKMTLTNSPLINELVEKLTNSKFLMQVQYDAEAEVEASLNIVRVSEIEYTKREKVLEVLMRAIEGFESNTKLQESVVALNEQVDKLSSENRDLEQKIADLTAINEDSKDTEEVQEVQ